MARPLEILLALFGIIALFPIIIVSALLVAIMSPGPVLFRQERVGRDGELFEILKFRSMTAKPCDGASLVTAAGDSRITPVGRILRKSKIDELPQLFNVIRGDMSFVGPRPEVPELIGLYSDTVRQTMLSVRPGITDTASIVFRDEETELAAQSDPATYYRDVIVPRKGAIYCDYIPRKSTIYDLKIILQTLARIVGVDNNKDSQ